MAHLWAMSAIVINIDKMYHVIGLLENLVISNDLADQVNLAQMDDKELKEFMLTSIDGAKVAIMSTK